MATNNNEFFTLCPPAVWTKPLPGKFVSDGPKLRRLVEIAWVSPENPKGIKLDQWQADLLDCLLQRYPDDWPDEDLRGQLRFRQVLVSIPRQHGKTLLGAILGLYGLLMHEPGPYVVGVASSAEQARLIYDRILFTVQSNRDLAKRFSKMTETRGIRTKDGSGRYEVKASKSAALQGIPISVGLFDELHIAKREMWQAIVNGQAARQEPILIGITTAGDEASDLLIDLYATADRAAAGDPDLERFGAFIWQAETASMPTTREELEAAILQSNPAVAEGRLSLKNLVADAATQPPADVLRYRLNRFVAAVSAFLRLDQWDDLRGDVPRLTRPVVAVSASPEKGHATVTLSQMIDGTTYTEVVASLVQPTTAELRKVCEDLFSLNPVCYVINGYTLPALAIELDNAGYPVRYARAGDMTQASSHLYALVANKRLVHDGNALLYNQIPRAMRKNVGDQFRISATESSAEIDALYSTAFGCLYAEIEQEETVSLFF